MCLLNVLINGYEGSVGKQILTYAFKDIHLGYCGALNRSKEDAPDLSANEYVWHGPLSLENLDWRGICPLDEAIVESMRECEAVCMDMLTRREAQGRTYTCAERKHLYLMMLRYWNHIIEEKKINLLLSYDVPHRLRSFVIYMLCKSKGIPTLLCTHADPLHDYILFFSDWEDPIPKLKDFSEVLKSEGSEMQNIELPENFQMYLDNQEVPLFDDDKAPWPKSLAPLHLHFWKRKLIHVLRLLRAKRLFKFYDQNAYEPDLSKKFIYLPLQLQPECSTCPMAGAYADQILIAQMLGALVPDDVMIYLKEHPNQQRKHPDGKCRSKDFYRDLLAIRNVCFVPRSFNTFKLMENCIAVATATGTAGFEGVFQGKPTLLFGHRYFQYAPGIFQIHSTEDCRKALSLILEEGVSPTKEEMSLYMNALAKCSVHGYSDLRRKGGSKLSEDENAKSVGSILSDHINKLVQV